jgi:hypothetical protein
MPPSALMEDIKPAVECGDFTAMAMQVAKQLQLVQESFMSMLQERQLIQLTNYCTRIDVVDEQVVYREGDESDFLGFILR